MFGFALSLWSLWTLRVLTLYVLLQSSFSSFRWIHLAVSNAQIFLYHFFSPWSPAQHLAYAFSTWGRSWWLSKPRNESCCFAKNWIIFPVFCAAGCAGSVQRKQSPCLWLRLRCWDNCVIFKCSVLLNAAGKRVISSAVHKRSYCWLKWMRSILCSTLDCGWNGGGMSTTTTGHVTLRWGKDFKI